MSTTFCSAGAAGVASVFSGGGKLTRDNIVTYNRAATARLPTLKLRKR
jgi:hypothetical protein